MGIHDRDYYRKSLPRGGFGHFGAATVTTWLIVLNVAVFFADGILQRASPPPDVDDVAYADPAAMNRWMLASTPPLQRAGSFSIEKAIRHGQVWRFLTFQFLHSSVMHLLFNMIGLFFFGPIVEAQFGGRRYLAFYLLCGLAGAVTFVLLAVSHVLRIAPDAQLIGASGGIFGLLVAAAIIAPDVQIVYYIIPVTIRMAAIFGMLMAAYAVLAYGQFNAGGEAAHLGGGILGFAFMKNQHWLNPFAPRRHETIRTTSPASAPRRHRARAYQKDWSKDFNR